MKENKDNFTQRDVVLFTFGQLDNPEMSESIQEDLQKDNSRAKELFSQYRQKRQNLEDKINSGEMSRVVQNRIARRAVQEKPLGGTTRADPTNDAPSESVSDPRVKHVYRLRDH